MLNSAQNQLFHLKKTISDLQLESQSNDEKTQFCIISLMHLSSIGGSLFYFKMLTSG